MDEVEFDQEIISRVRESASGDSWVSDSDIVPDETQAELIGWRDAFTSGSFRIGDIANDLVVKAAKTGFIVTNMRVYGAVGKFCGRSARTVRYYAEAASFYPRDIRDEFDVLPFAHFVLAKSLGDWRGVLEFALEHPEATMDELRGKYLGREEKREVSQDNPPIGAVAAPMVVTSSLSDHTEMCEESQKYRVANAFGDLLTALDCFKRAIPGLEIDEHEKGVLESEVEDFRGLVVGISAGMV